MAEDAAGAEALPEADHFDAQVEEGRRVRLPFLWIICVLLGLGGMLCVTLFVLAKPLGMLVFGALAAIHFAVAVGLWKRRRAALVGATVLLGISAALCLSILAANPHRDVVYLIPLCLSLAMLAYLWLRRAHFRAADGPMPSFRSTPGIIAIGIVFGLGIPFILLMTVDDATQSFPALEVERLEVPDEQNGFVVLQEIAESWTEEQREAVSEVLDARLELDESTPEWQSRAATVLRDNEGRLRKINEMLARPHFAPPIARSVRDVADAMDWQQVAREMTALLRLQCQVQMVPGETAEAMATAWKLLQLGLAISENNGSMLNWLTGTAILHVGLEQVRQVAGQDGLPSLSLRESLDRLEMTEPLIRASNRSLATEYQLQTSMLKSMKTEGLEALGLSAEEIQDVSGPAWARALLRVRMPLLKVNMTANMLGESLGRAMITSDRYEPLPPRYRIDGVSGMVKTFGLVSLVRNPLGDVHAAISIPITYSVRGTCFGAMASARLTRAYLALRAYQLTEGRLPDELSALVPDYLDAVPEDPFIAEPLQYDAAASPPKIWSVGPDQQTDPPGTPESQRNDIALELTFAGD